jgi:hypothetical protein
MPNQIKILRSATAGARPTGKTAGEPYVNFADGQFGVWNAAAVDLLAVRFWLSTASYAVNDVVLSAGDLYVCVTPNTNSPPPSVNWAPVVGGATGVDSFNGRTGVVVLTVADVTAVLPAGITPPLMDGVATPGISNSWSRADHVHPSDTSRLALAGGVMTGQITTLPPVAGTDAANKNYVDGQIGNLQLFLGTWEVANNSPNLTITGSLTAGDYFIAVTAVPSVPESPPVNIPGIPTTASVANGDLVIWNAGSSIFEIVVGSGLTMAEADALYVRLNGGIMTGPLTLNATPPALNNSLTAATTAYVDNAVIDAGTF